MNRDDYLKNEHVKKFIEFLNTSLDEFNHNYVFRKTRNPWSCTSIIDAAENYQWNGKDLNETTDSLAKLREELQNAFKNKSDEQMKLASIKIFRWGGVLNGNKARVMQEKDLYEKYRKTIAQLSQSGDDDILDQVYNMNAGLTKVYSLLTDEIVMYDSRVGAAMAYLVNKLMPEGNIPDELAFAWASGKTSVTAVKLPVLVPFITRGA